MATKKATPVVKGPSAFLAAFNKDMSKVEGLSHTSAPPRYWWGFGNQAINAVMSGNYTRGIPQGRITGIVGPSGAGKSFLVGNIIKSAQQDGAIILVVDSESALDDDYMGKIGVDTTANGEYLYKGVKTVAHVIKVVSTFIKGYREAYGDGEDAPKVLIAIDSLNMLQTDSSAENYNKGINKGDQGQKAKQIKNMLLDFVQDIKGTNISIIITGHVYKNTDVMNGEGVWIVNDGMKFALSQIVLVTKLKFKDEKTKKFEGIQLKVFGYKTRFCKPFQSVTIDLPYDKPMDRYSGLFEIAKTAGLVVKAGNRWHVVDQDELWYEKDFSEVAAETILIKLQSHVGLILEAQDAVDDPDQENKITD
jgi:recombination protein RecA